MSHKIEKALRKLNISNRIFAGVTASIIIFTVIVLVFVNTIVRSTMEKHYVDNDTELQTETAKSMELLITDVNLLSVRLMGNENIYRILKSKELTYEEKETAYKEAVSAVIKNTRVAEVIVLDNDGNIFSTDSVEGFNGKPNEKSCEILDESAYRLGVCGISSADDGTAFLCLGRKYYFYSMSVSVGYIFVYIKDTEISKTLYVSESDSTSMLISEEGLILSCNNKSEIGKYMYSDTVFTDDVYRNFSFPYKGGDGILSMRRVYELDGMINARLYTANLYSEESLFGNIDRLILIVVGCELAFVLLAIIFCFKNANKIVKPIHRLQSNLKDFGQDGELVPSYIGGNDEFAELETTYNEMLNRIAELTRKNIDEKLEQRKLQLDALQAQINPHFLYNTLDTIVWIAKIKKQKEIEELALALARFFRISLHKGDKFISVREEIDFVKGFVLIQQTRFPNKFEIEFDIPDEILDCRIFKIMIQPFVENSIKHGISPKHGSGRITVSGRREGDDLIFKIIDDGIGVEQSANCAEQGELVGLHGYGIKNVDERIRLEYGDNYGVTIESELNKGTAVTVKVPFKQA